MDIEDLKTRTENEQIHSYLGTHNSRESLLKNQENKRNAYILSPILSVDNGSDEATKNDENLQTGISALDYTLASPQYVTHASTSHQI